MKNMTLTVKIWLALSLISLLLYLIAILVMPFLVRNFFTDTLLGPPHEPPQHPSGKNNPQDTLPSFFSLRGFKYAQFNYFG